jgi:hypothetical protein
MARSLIGFVALVSALAPGRVAAKDCTIDGLHRALDGAFSAYAMADLGRFEDSRDDAREALGCLEERLGPQLASSVYQLEALDSYLPPRNLERAVQSFHAAREASPGYSLPAALAPEGNLLRTQWELAGERTSAIAPLPPPEGFTLYVDGYMAASRPINRPVILQLVQDADGAVVWTGYLSSGAPDPSWEGVGVGSASSGLTIDDGGSHRATLPLALGAAGTAALSGGLFALALSSRTSLYQDRGYPGGDPLPASVESEVEATRRTINGIGYAAQATGAVALGLGGAAVLSLRW